MEGSVWHPETVTKLVGRAGMERNGEHGEGCSVPASGGSGPCVTEMAKIQRKATKITKNMERP